MTEKRRAPIEVLERLANEVDEYEKCGRCKFWENSFNNALAAYRAAHIHSPDESGGRR